MSIREERISLHKCENIIHENTRDEDDLWTECLLSVT